MGKRSNFERIEKDKYMTIDPKAITPTFIEHTKGSTYYEPCVGAGDLVRLLADHMVCVGSSDIETGKDALDLTIDDVGDCDYIITNPPWSRGILHPLIDHFRALKPTWLLFDADWMHTKQAKPYLEYCYYIVSVGRLKWIPDTNMTGKDNVCWYCFWKDKNLHKGISFQV